MKNHDKLFITGMNFTQKTNGLIKKILFKSREQALNKIESKLTKSFFEKLPFDWFCGSEFYGDYPEIKFEVNKICKKYNCLEFDIFIPKETIMNFKNLTEDEISLFYENLYNEVIDVATGECLLAREMKKHKTKFTAIPIFKGYLEQDIVDLIMAERINVCDIINRENKKSPTSRFKKVKIGVIEYYGEYEEISCDFQQLNYKVETFLVNLKIPFQKLTEITANKDVEKIGEFYCDLYMDVLGEVKTSLNIS